MVLLFQAWASLCGFEPYSGFDVGGTGLAQSAFSAHDTRERQDTHWRGSITITVEVARRMGCHCVLQMQPCTQGLVERPEPRSVDLRRAPGT